MFRQFDVFRVREKNWKSSNFKMHKFSMCEMYKKVYIDPCY